MESISEKDLGFQIAPFTLFPLPRVKVGKEFTRVVNGSSCSYFCSSGVPYTAIDRRWLEIVTTLGKRQYPEPCIEFGSISSTLKQYGMARANNYILPARKALEKIARLHISITRITESKGVDIQQGIDISVSERHQILWARGRANLVEPELFDGENFMDISSGFLNLVKDAAPHIQADYMAIQSPLMLDVYQWLIRRLYGMKDDALIRWAWIYAQFGNGEILNDSQMKDLRRKFKETVAEIQAKYYPGAIMKFTDEGLILFRSPPLIEPDSKKAGYSLL